MSDYSASSSSGQEPSEVGGYPEGTTIDGGETRSSYSFSDSDGGIDEIRKTIERETKEVRQWRLVVILAMLLVGGATTAATYFFVSNQETQDLETSLEQYAATIIESSRFSASKIRDSCSDFADVLTSSALSLGATWPFFTLPNFEVHSKNVLEQTGSVGFWISPTVTDEQKNNWTSYTLANSAWLGQPISPFIFYVDEDENPVTHYPGTSAPIWQIYPLPLDSVVNFDLNTIPGYVEESTTTAILREGFVAPFLANTALVQVFPTLSNFTPNPDEPYSGYYQPVFDTFDDGTSKVVAKALMFLRWGSYFTNKLPDDVGGIHLVLENDCNDTATWEISGKDALYLGRSDLHDRAYDSYRISSGFNTYQNPELAFELGACVFKINIYPSAAFEDVYKSNLPIITAFVVGSIFASMVLTFLAYDRFQRKRNTKVVTNAAKSNNLLTSLFPKNIRDRLLEPTPANSHADTDAAWYTNSKSNKGQLQNFLDGDKGEESPGSNGRPIADLFLETTIMFADITGFTAWSSTRQPSQVFALLETVFAELDHVAKKRRVFKVETVGDCYVAVAGLPEPRRDHAVAMARFALETLARVRELMKHLETSMGPDTADLGIRIGLHSGSCTAGVLRGDRARFQLFGDAVNTTARIESSGAKNRIHMSKETADLLRAAGKGHWAQPRESPIKAKGKGEMETFWLRVLKPGAQSVSSSTGRITDGALDAWGDAEVEDTKLNRLVDWQVDVLVDLLKQVVARRSASTASIRPGPVRTEKSGGACLDEVKEIITLPEFDARAAKRQRDPQTIELGEDVLIQLRDYVSTVACMYRKNGFHNYEHACHVAMSVTKLLSRIVMPSDLAYEHDEESSGARTTRRSIASTLHDHTFGITSDPLTQFSLVFSAMIHDVDHTGVPNVQLVKEKVSLAAIYRNKSVAEQNSIDLAWDLLLRGNYRELRACIYSTQAEFDRFRQLVVQAVLATDIADGELKVLRNERWDHAFAEKTREEDPRDTVNRKATIIIEHLIQASDVAHTMQHWHVYRKWNECFFRECHQAYKDGRSDSDPAVGWYKGELGFFDFYIIPLAKKLKKCGVFGVSSDEYLNYALKNRKEWEDRGQEVVEEMVAMLAEQEGEAEKSLLAVEEEGRSLDDGDFSEEFTDEQKSSP